jgi:hypothetical protein
VIVPSLKLMIMQSCHSGSVSSLIFHDSGCISLGGVGCKLRHSGRVWLGVGVVGTETCWNLWASGVMI